MKATLKPIGFVVSLAILSLLCSLPVLAQSAREVAKRTFPSVVILLMEDQNGQLSALGSGFVVEEGIIASNLHVVRGASRGLVRLIGDSVKYEIEGIVASDSTNDLALVKVTGLKAPKLSLGNSDLMSVGDEIYAVGNPRGLEGTFSQGIVSSVRKLDNGSLIQITAPISPGSSGGPILDTDGKVVGVAVATFKDGQNLNFAIPANALRPLLQSRARPHPLSSLPKTAAQHSILKDLGPRSTAGVTARRFEWGGTIGDEFKFSVFNQLRQPVKDVTACVIFFDDEDMPIEFKMVALKSMIPAGLATWSESLRLDKTTAGYCSGPFRKMFATWAKGKKEGKVEVRILEFHLTE